MWYERLESIVSSWEEQASVALAINAELLKMFMTMIEEIKQAAAEGRTTVILDEQGFALPVMSARELVVMSRMMSQVMSSAEKGTSITTGFRTSQAVDPEAGKGAGEKTPHEMSDMDLALAIENGGLEVPPILRKKVDALVKKAEGQ